MISSTKTKRGNNYCVFSISLDENGCLQISNPHNPEFEWSKEVIHPIIPRNQTGTLLFVSNKYTAINDDFDELDHIILLCSEINNTEIMIDHESSTYEELCKLWCPLIQNGLEINYNKENCIGIPFIKQEDNIIINTNNHIYCIIIVFLLK